LRIFSIDLIGDIFLIMLTVPGWSQQPNSHAPRPGSINYVEGQASIGVELLSPTAIGSIDLAKDQVLTTQAGKVEVLLTPGVFLRVADNSAITMTSPDLANTIVRLDKGRALVEVLDIRKQNNVQIEVGGASTKLLKDGLYDFDADHGTIRVFTGKAEARANDQKVKLSEQQQLILNSGEQLTSQSFDTRPYEDDFFRWSALRSGYLSEATVDEARACIGTGVNWYGPAWSGAGWYWDPWFEVWTFIPVDGISYSPFGWGFYSPVVVYRSPFFYGGYYGNAPHRFNEFHFPYGHGFIPRGGFYGGGFYDGDVAPSPGGHQR
jgi:hypothetical protein